MKKLLTTLALTLGLLFGGMALMAPAANAEGGACGLNTPCDPPACGLNPCPVEDPPACGLNPCPTAAELGGWDKYAAELAGRVATLEQTANEYRQRIVALEAEVASVKAKADRLQRVADRRAATIKRLRAALAAARA
jgi:hypothetical protein